MVMAIKFNEDESKKSIESRVQNA
jgi:hypothetical protein